MILFLCVFSKKKLRRKRKFNIIFRTFFFDLSFHSLMIYDSEENFSDDCSSLDVAFHVKRKVITARETTITMTAFEWFGSSVFSVVSRQLIWSSKSPFTSFPRTFVRFFSWKKRRRRVFESWIFLIIYSDRNF